jgi:3-deoxy-D-manno-octulosonic-acid transferase
MRVVYNILFGIFFVLSSPYYFLRMYRRGNWQTGFWQRFGVFDAKFKQSITNRHVLWLHAVSVGEVNICTQLIHALEPRLPNAKIVVSTTTTTGMGELQKKLPVHIGKFYFPIDRRKYAMRTIATLHPEAVVLVEAEIWPNFIWRLQEKRIPLFLVNARLSNRSYRGYKRFGFLFRSLFGSFTAAGAQSEADAVKLREIGCRPEAVRVVGSLKFDAAKLSGPRTIDVPAMLRQLGVPPEARILVGGSTHAGEEAMLAEQFLRLRAKFPDLFLILIPRHFERCKHVGGELRERGVKFTFRNEITSSAQFKSGDVNCLLVNTTGELRYFYEHATVIFVGKSIKAEGGQNPIEPCALGKPTIFGPNMQNFMDVTRIILSGGGAIQVRDAAELEKVFGELLSDEARRQKLGENAATVVRENIGALARTVEMIIHHLKNTELYIK